MTKQQYAIESMASDLKRVALGLERGSTIMANRFLDEALKRKDEIQTQDLPSYIIQIINRIPMISLSGITDRTPDDCLMYAQLLQNYSRN